MSVEIFKSSVRACNYLEHQKAQEIFIVSEEISSNYYQKLMDLGYRRSGNFFYLPTCIACQECIPIRIPIKAFVPSKNQRRVHRKNRDIIIKKGDLCITPEKLKLYIDYQLYQHKSKTKTKEQFYEELEEFLFASSIDTIEFDYYLKEELVGVGIVDIADNYLSSVYFYFSPEQNKRSLGTYSILWEIEYANQININHYYLGYYIKECPQMNYKNRFKPYELLINGKWEKYF